MGGLVQNSNEAIFKNCKKLYEIGEDSLSPLIEAILPHDWSKIENKSQMRLLSGIVSLINDINEDACKQTAELIITKGCTQAVKQCLNSITSFSLNNYISYTMNDVQVYISNDLKNEKHIKFKLKNGFLSFQKKIYRRLTEYMLSLIMKIIVIVVHIHQYYLI